MAGAVKLDDLAGHVHRGHERVAVQKANCGDGLGHLQRERARRQATYRIFGSKPGSYVCKRI